MSSPCTSPLILLLSMVCSSNAACRRLDFQSPLENIALDGHVIETGSVASEEICQVRCYLQKRCASYNVGPQINGVSVCEISDSDDVMHSGDMKSRQGFLFRAAQNPCHSSPCGGHNSTCLVGFTDKGFECECGPGSSGERCSEIDECFLQTHNCSSDAQCYDTRDSFNCSCNSGYQGDGVNCPDIDECSLQTDNCSAHAWCQNRPGSFSCHCDSGYSGDGVNCSEIVHYHWRLDGRDTDVKTFGAASYVYNGDRDVLDLTGQGFAVTPSVNIDHTNFSLSCWIRITSYSANAAFIYGAWSYRHKFRLYVHHISGLCINLRRFASYPDSEMVHFCKGKIETDHWEHVAFTWNRNAATLFINGVLIKKSFPQIVADLVSSSHHVYDIGFKRDSSHYAGGFFRDLHLYKRALTAEEVEDLFQVEQ